jgi:16S rRNA (guanine(966)-N(2))-methyltransferase RsmD
VRIIRGTLKTKKITVPKNFPSRPTTDFAKEGLFNMLENRLDIDGSELLDLCAGTGNISFEFLSRGAKSVVAVDSNFNVTRHIRHLAKDFELLPSIQIVHSDILKFLEKTEQKFDVVFADPPYEFKHYEQLVQLVADKQLLKEDGLLIVEHGKRTAISHLKGYESSRGYGNVVFSFFPFSHD